MHFYYIADADTIPIDTKVFALEGRQSAVVQTNWLVINKAYDLYAEIRSSDPQEYDESDNTIATNSAAGRTTICLCRRKGRGSFKKLRTAAGMKAPRR